MNRWPLGLAIAAELWCVEARADAPFACSAEKSGITYTVELTGPSDRRSMSVTDSRGTITSGRATLYRHGTRFFLPGPSRTGFKLGIEGDKASLCFDDGGNDCHACQPLSSRRERYLRKQTCFTNTPRGNYWVTLYFSGEPSPEMVLWDEQGELASGPARYSVRSETFASLQVGPNEFYYYQVDANALCTQDQYECYPCSLVEIDDNNASMVAPATILAQCEYAGIDALLYEQGGDTFLDIDYHQRGSDFGDEEGWYAGPATYIGGDRWEFGVYRLSLLGSVAELCTPWNGCGPCVYARDPLH